MPKPCIISAAITGAIHTPSMSDALPVTAAEIVDQAVGAARAGAAIVHLHARDEHSGAPDQSAEAFAAILPVLASPVTRERKLRLCATLINLAVGAGKLEGFSVLTSSK